MQSPALEWTHRSRSVGGFPRYGFFGRCLEAVQFSEEELRGAVHIYNKLPQAVKA